MALNKIVLGPQPVSERGVINGHYRAYATVAVTPAANAILASFRWVAAAATNGTIGYTNQAPQVMVLLRASITIDVVTAVTAQRQDPLSIVAVRAYTASDSTSATAFTLTGNNAKANTKFATSNFNTNGFMGVTSANGGSSGGTGTQDSQPFGVAGLPAPLTGLGQSVGTIDLYRADLAQTEYPFVFANNEGARVLWGATTLATGSISVTIGFEWAEVVYY